MSICDNEYCETAQQHQQLLCTHHEIKLWVVLSGNLSRRDVFPIPMSKCYMITFLQQAFPINLQAKHSTKLYFNNNRRQGHNTKIQPIRTGTCGWKQLWHPRHGRFSLGRDSAEAQMENLLFQWRVAINLPQLSPSCQNKHTTLPLITNRITSASWLEHYLFIQYHSTSNSLGVSSKFNPINCISSHRTWWKWKIV